MSVCLNFFSRDTVIFGLRVQSVTAGGPTIIAEGDLITQ